MQVWKTTLVYNIMSLMYIKRIMLEANKRTQLLFYAFYFNVSFINSYKWTTPSVEYDITIGQSPFLLNDRFVSSFQASPIQWKKHCQGCHYRQPAMNDFIEAIWCIRICQDCRILPSLHSHECVQAPFLKRSFLFSVLAWYCRI